MIARGATYVLPQEPGLRLEEMDEQVPGDGEHRMRSIYFVRDTEVYVYREDLGKIEANPGRPLRVIGGYRDPKTKRLRSFHSVSELRDMAAQARFNAEWAPSDTDPRFGQVMEELIHNG